MVESPHLASNTVSESVPVVTYCCCRTINLRVPVLVLLCSDVVGVVVAVVWIAFTAAAVVLPNRHDLGVDSSLASTSISTSTSHVWKETIRKFKPVESQTRQVRVSQQHRDVDPLPSHWHGLEVPVHEGNFEMENDQELRSRASRDLDFDVAVYENIEYEYTSIAAPASPQSGASQSIMTQLVSIPSIFPTSEWLALQALFNATGGLISPGWRWYGTGAPWDFGLPLSTTHNPCYSRWEGVLCSCNLTKPITIFQEFYPYYGYYDDRTSPAVKRVNATCSVVKLLLDRHSLRGTIPRRIGDLGNLTHLRLRSNALSGSFPSGLLGLSKLQMLLMGNNQLFGYLPTNVISWSASLRVLFLGGNSFTSTLPSSWSVLSELKILALFSNSLYGTLPHSWSALSGLQQLYLFSNSLQGTLPQPWSALSGLQLAYLYSNSLRGTLPQSWSGLHKLQRLYLYSNSLDGTLPSSWSALSVLQLLSLYSNSLNGTLPQSWSAIGRLQDLFLYSNSLQGTLPQSWSALSEMKYINLHLNSLQGTLPQSWSAISGLQQLYLYSNSLNGTLPPSWSALSGLQYLYLYSNSLYGTLPQSWSVLCRLQELYLSANSLQGSLPQSWSALSGLQRLYLYSNILQGPLPQSWSALSRLQYLYLYSNSLEGTLPQSWSALFKLQSLYLFDNSLNGILPSQWSALNRLQELYLHSNNLTGSIPSEVGKLVSLELLLLNNNYFTGVIPSSLFRLPSLTSLSLALNCFTIASFSDGNLCAARNLTVLVMDGIHSALRCDNIPLFMSDQALGYGGGSTYALGRAGTGVAKSSLSSAIALPLCLLLLPRLTTLHVSGAGLVGDLSTVDVDRLSPNLTDLVLSHNYLYGSIPLAMQHRTSWQQLDLSFNLLGGTLAGDISFNASVTTNLDVSNNRLSGVIPGGLLYQPNVSILQGNHFSCSLFNTSTNLPIHDPYEAQYRCNSSEFNISVLVWGCVLVLSTVMAYLVGIHYLGYRYFAISDLHSSIISLFRVLFENHIVTNSRGYSFPGVRLMETSLSSVRLSTVKLTLVICLLMLVYSLFKLPGLNYTEVTVQGAFLVSVTLLEGYMPAIVIALLYLMVELGGYAWFRANSLIYETSGDALASISIPYRSRCLNVWGYIDFVKTGRYSMIILANIVVVVVINGAYVAAYFAYSSSIVRLISFVLSVFKVLWTQLCLPYFLSYIRSYNRSVGQVNGKSESLTSTWLYVSLVVINTVIVPSLSIIIVAPQCARDVFVPPPVISSSITFCLIRNIVTVNGVNTRTSCFQTQTIATVYRPPFLYSNQCSFALLSGYADVFTYTFVLSGFVIPGLLYLLSLLVHRLYKSMSKAAPEPVLSESWLFCLIADMLPQWLLPLPHIQAARASRTLRKMVQVMRTLGLTKQHPDRCGKNDSSEHTVVGLEFVGFDVNGTDTIAPMHNDVSSDVNKTAVSGISEHRPSNVASLISLQHSGSTHNESSVSSALTIFRGDAAVAQVIQALSICLSFGVVFPPLCLLGALSLVLYSLFAQHTVRAFASSIATPEPLSGSRTTSLSSHSESVATFAVTTVNGLSVSEIRATLDAECRHFSSALWHCLSIPFMASFPVLAFFLWEIVSVSHPNAISYTIILPVLFLALTFVCWQLLRMSFKVKSRSVCCDCLFLSSCNSRSSQGWQWLIQRVYGGRIDGNSDAKVKASITA